MTQVVMNPQSLVVHVLTPEDEAELRKTRLIVEGGNFDDAIMHKMCITQAIQMLITPVERRPKKERNRPFWFSVGSYSDSPICVSRVITTYLTELNDLDHISARQRAELKKLVTEVMNTCPVKRWERKLKMMVQITEERDFSYPGYRTAEDRRVEIFDRVAARDMSIPFTKKMAAVREAAALFKVTPTGVQSSQNIWW